MIKESQTTDHSCKMEDEELSSSCSAKETNSATSGTTGQDDAENLYFAKVETRRVRGLKFLVFGILFLVTVAVCLSVYFVTDKGQQHEFESSFEAAAVKVIESFEDVLEEKLAALAAFGVTLTANSDQGSNSSWPFITVNDFQERAASTRGSAGVLSLQFVPIVQDTEATQWGVYSVKNKGWIDEGRAYQTERGMPDELTPDQGESQIFPKIYEISNATTTGISPAKGPGPFYPVWQQSPIPPEPYVNFNLVAYPDEKPFIKTVASTGQLSIGRIITAPPGGIDSDDLVTRSYAYYLSLDKMEVTEYTGEPMSTVFVPIMNSFNEDREPAALFVAVSTWGSYFEELLGPLSTAIRVVLENTCDGAFTYEVRGTEVVYLGPGNLGDPAYEEMVIEFVLDEEEFEEIEENTVELTLNQDMCRYSLHVYPTQSTDMYYNDNFPIAITFVIAAVFFLTATVFLMYDIMVERRQKVILDSAKRSNAIVSSIFPRKVRDQLMAAPVQGNATKLRSMAMEKVSADGNGLIGGSAPIADLFPKCTVMFADVEGFTAWSSVREPSQVFTLLETIYAAMDRVASKRNVFKVETVGDCYVAVCGLPDPNERHAVTMALFARDCIVEHTAVVKRLELILGPETGELRLRVGLNSGPITAGVLRGQRSRFQLFGDTVNTGARLESSSDGNRIHVSAITADLIREAGYDHWIEEREDPVHLKGKGSMTTFWVNPHKKERKTSSSQRDMINSLIGLPPSNPTRKNLNLIAWNKDVVVKLIKQIVARRGNEKVSVRHLEWKPRGTNPLEEVVEIIQLPDSVSTPTKNSEDITLDPKIEDLVFEYISCLADLYHDNSFHCFEHASHVTMSVAKLMSRIVAPSDMDFSDNDQATARLHDHTYGITSDPLTQFACVLSALIHDVDHQGVPNTALVTENDPVSQRYKGKSVAEQNSVDQAWDLLMTEQFKPLVAVVCQTDAELTRLRQLVVNCVMATDIMDPDLKMLRNTRWERAFEVATDSGIHSKKSRVAIDRKATIVIEHLLQASDVSHTMQHWAVYTKWNARLFKEMYKAYLDGRGGAKDPSEFWAKGEIGFFDFYIIPLAKKLKECGVFGVSSDEYLQYAISNRNEWERKGQSIVEGLIEQVHTEYGKPMEGGNGGK